jgi:signal transduction histidine kinase
MIARLFTERGETRSERSNEGAVMIAIGVVLGTAALIADVSPVWPLVFGVFALACWNVVHRRSRIVQSIVSSIERQRDELAEAHSELGMMHEQLTEEIAARERAEMELRQAQKLEAIGRLAAGVAHEINTPMQFIGNNLDFIAEGTLELIELAKRCVPADEAAAVDLEYLSEHLPTALSQSSLGVQRVAAIVRSMRQVAHPGDDDGRALIDVNTTILNALTLSNHEYKLVADVVTDLGPIPVLRANGGELNQVFINLIVNASHAIADVSANTSRRGSIHIRSCVEGDTVVVYIRDTGGGIPDAIRAKVFEPFFTTKSVGHGSGQGLAIARAVLDRSGGELSFESDAGVGTTFRIALPIVSHLATGEIRRVA